MATGNLTAIGNAAGDLCQSIRSMLFPFGALEALVFIVFAIASYYSYGKYGKTKNMAWLAAAAISALISIFSLIGALLVFVTPSFVSALYGAPANC